MAHGLHYVTGARLAFRAQHGRALAHTPERLAQVARPADERHLEEMFVDVMLLVGGRQNFGFVDAVNADGLENLRFDEMPDPALGHDRDRHGLFDANHQLRVAHARYPAVRANIGGHALQRHHRARTGLLGNPGLLRRDYIADYPALEHLRECAFYLYGSCLFFHDHYASLANTCKSV